MRIVTTRANRRSRPTVGSKAFGEVRTSPNTDSGTTAVPTRAAVRRVRNERPRPSAGSAPGSSIGAVLAVRPEEPIADATDRHEVLRVVGVDLDLLAQTAHRDPDIRGVGVLGLGPAPDEERLRRDGLADVRGKRVEQARFGRRQLDGGLADGGLAAVQVEREVRARGRGSGGEPCRRGGASPG